MTIRHLALSLLAVCSTACASAVDRPTPPQAEVPNDPFARFDANHDGVLSREEFAAAQAAGPERPGCPGPDGQPGDGRRPLPPKPEELFAALDRNHDGAVAKDEFIGGMGELARQRPRGPAGRPDRDQDERGPGDRPRDDRDGPRQRDDERGPRGGDRDEGHRPPPRDDRRGPREDERDDGRRPPPRDAERGPRGEDERDEGRRPPPRDDLRDEGRRPPRGEDGPGRPGPGQDGPRDDRGQGDRLERGRPDERGGGERRPGPGPRLDHAFTTADADGNGSLTPEEFRAALRALPRPPAPPRRDD